MKENDTELMHRVKRIKESDISERIIWGSIFLVLSGVVIIFLGYMLSRRYLWPSPESIGIKLDVDRYALLFLVTFLMGWGSLRTGKLLRIIKYLYDREQK
jgi:hypothetical protein